MQKQPDVKVSQNSTLSAVNIIRKQKIKDCEYIGDIVDSVLTCIGLNGVDQPKLEQETKLSGELKQKESKIKELEKKIKELEKNDNND